MSVRSNVELLDDILESISRIYRYTEGMDFKSFSNDDKTVDAVVRNFEVIGEAANRLDERFKTSNPEVQWTRIIGLRHRIVHEYFGIDLQIIWNIIQNNLSQFNKQIQAVKEDLD